MPAQQSAFTVQLAPVAWHDVPVPPVPPVLVKSAHLPLVQAPLQQSALAAQIPPVSLQVAVDAAGRHAKNVPVSPAGLQESPEQQLVVSLSPLHFAPNGWHDGTGPPPHFRIPSFGSGAQASPLQHWSLNWQTWPGSMQHCGFVPS